MRVALLLLMLSGCATVVVRPGLQLTTLPSGIPWCVAAGPQPIPPSASADSPDRSELITGAVIRRCSPMLTDACMQSLDGVQVWRGSIGFELSSDEQGHVSGVCVVGGNFGNVTDYVGCLANEIQRHAAVPPNLKSVSWTLTYVCE